MSIFCICHDKVKIVSAQSQKWDLGLIFFGFDWGPLGTWGLGLGLGLDNGNCKVLSPKESPIQVLGVTLSYRPPTHHQ